jgi:hypothetical protein
VYWIGICCPSWKALLISCMALVPDLPAVS